MSLVRPSSVRLTRIFLIVSNMAHSRIAIHHIRSAHLLMQYAETRCGDLIKINALAELVICFPKLKFCSRLRVVAPEHSYSSGWVIGLTSQATRFSR